MLFAVIREQGAGWAVSRAMREQQYWPEHVKYVNGLEDEGFLVLAGPIGESESDADPTAPVGEDRVYRALLIVRAARAADVSKRLADDPWTRSRVLETKAIHRWEALGGELSGTVSDAAP
jgi:uncharacterized protein YciI